MRCSGMDVRNEKKASLHSDDGRHLLHALDGTHGACVSREEREKRDKVQLGRILENKHGWNIKQWLVLYQTLLESSRSDGKCLILLHSLL